MRTLRLFAFTTAMLLTAGSLRVTAQSGLTIHSYEVVSSTRVGRTTFDYLLRAKVSSSLAYSATVAARVTSSSQTTIVLEDTLQFGVVAAGATQLSTDTFKIRQDRISAFSPAGLNWSFIVNVPPTIQITSPGNNAHTILETIQISGLVGGGPAGSVSVNGMAANVNGNTFNKTIPLQMGVNPVTAVISGPGGVNQADITIHRDPPPPIIALTSPANDARFQRDIITVSGTASGPVASVEVNGVAVALVNGSFTSQAALALGENTITASAQGPGGTADASILVHRDPLILAVDITSPAEAALVAMGSITVSGTFGIGVTDVQVNNIAATLNGNQFSAQITLQEGDNSITAAARDGLGNAGTDTVHLTLDTLAPQLTLALSAETDSEPVGDGQTTFEKVTVFGHTEPLLAVLLEVGTESSSMELNGMSDIGGNFQFNDVPLTLGENDLFATTADTAGNQQSAELFITRVQAESEPPTIPAIPIINYPVNATMAAFVIFTGTSAPNTHVRVEGGAAYVTNEVNEAGEFELTVPLNPNRLNRLFVSAVDEFGQSSPLAPIDILQDSTPPFVFIDFPSDGAVLTTDQTLVAGRVGDALSGFLGLDVTVNGQPARVDVGIGPNGTYERGSVPLVEGDNMIVVIATDRLGNLTTRRITIRREIPTGPRLMAVSGDMQEANIVHRLAEPIIVRATHGNGNPFANKLLNFQVTRSDGRLLPFDAALLANDITIRPDYTVNGSAFVQIFTDSDGVAKVWWTMGMDAGHANNRLEVTGMDLADKVYFCASALALPAKQINIGSGNNQRGETLGPAAEPLKIWVSDGNNPVAGVPVTFRVIQGGGKLLPILTAQGVSPSGPGLRAGSRAVGSSAIQALDASDDVTVLSSITGHAEVDFTFGPGSGNQIIEATFPNNPGSPATFICYALTRTPGQPTTFVGLIQDNSLQPIGGAICELIVGDSTNRVASTPEGRFEFLNIPSGSGHLFINGFTATTLGTTTVPTNTFPSLHYTIAVIPNAENSLPSAVLLPRLNPNNGRWYDGTHDVVLTCEGMEGLKMTIKANSMKHPTGELVTPTRQAYISLNQVNHDDIPMPMPDGASPPFAWTLQPGGATFDPPVQVEYPNMSGLAAGAAAFFLTFNHDTERFEIVANGHVSEDGSTVLTDIGAGLTISGWGCSCPPYAISGNCVGCSTTCHETGHLPGGETLVSNTEVCPGGSFSFSASGVADSGGSQREVCKDRDGNVVSDRIISVSAGAISYAWQVTRNGVVIANGDGANTPSIAATQTGNYECVFTASVSRECAPNPRVLPPKSVTVRDPQISLIGVQSVGDLMDINTLRVQQILGDCPATMYGIQARRQGSQDWVYIYSGSEPERAFIWRAAGYFEIRALAFFGATVLESTAVSLEVQFPEAAVVYSDPGVVNEMERLWRETKNFADNDLGHVREYGFVVSFETEHGTFRVPPIAAEGLLATAAAFNDAVAKITLIFSDSSAPGTPIHSASYYVGSFHTHPPVSRAGPAFFRPVGFSEKDQLNFGSQAPGKVYDYVGEARFIPDEQRFIQGVQGEHDPEAQAKLYPFGPMRRPTPQ